MEEAKELANAEKKTYEVIVTKLKREIAAVTDKLRDEEKKRIKEVTKLTAENETLSKRNKKMQDDTLEEAKLLKMKLAKATNRVQELESASGQQKDPHHGDTAKPRAATCACETSKLQLPRMRKVRELNMCTS